MIFDSFRLHQAPDKNRCRSISCSRAELARRKRESSTKPKKAIENRPKKVRGRSAASRSILRSVASKDNFQEVALKVLTSSERKFLEHSKTRRKSSTKSIYPRIGINTVRAFRMLRNESTPCAISPSK